MIAEKGKTFAKGARKNRVQGGFLDCARNDSVGNGYPVHHAKKECVGNAFFSYRHPERSRGIFFVGGKRERARQRGTGNTVSRKGGDGASRKRLSEGVMEKRDEKDFYLRLKQCGGMIPSYRIYLCLFRAPFMIDASRK